MVRADAGGVEIRFEPLQNCQRCQRGEGCGAGVFSRLFAPRSASLRLPARVDLKPGAPVRVGVRPRELVVMALLLYALPLLAFMAAAGLTAILWPDHAAQDLVVVLGGLPAAGLALLLGRRWHGQVLNPVLEALSSEAVPATLESEPY